MDKIVRKVTCGINHSFFITAENEIYATGSNAYGQLGLSRYWNIHQNEDHEVVDSVYIPEKVTIGPHARIKDIITSHILCDR